MAIDRVRVCVGVRGGGGRSVVWGVGEWGIGGIENKTAMLWLGACRRVKDQLPPEGSPRRILQRPCSRNIGMIPV